MSSWKEHQTCCLPLSGLLVRFGFWARTSYFDHLGIWWIMYQTPWPLARATAVSMILLFWGGSSPETRYLWKPFKREWKKRSGIQLTKALSRPEIGWVWQDVSPSDPLPSQYFLTVRVGGRTYRLILTPLLAQVWWKSEPPQLCPPLGLPWTRLVTEAASWQAKHWEAMAVVPYPSACCMGAAYPGWCQGKLFIISN